MKKMVLENISYPKNLHNRTSLGGGNSNIFGIFTPNPWGRFPIWLPSRELTYPTLGKRKIIFKMPFLGDMLVPLRVIFFRWVGWNHQQNIFTSLRTVPRTLRRSMSGLSGGVFKMGTCHQQQGFLGVELWLKTKSTWIYGCLEYTSNIWENPMEVVSPWNLRDLFDVLPC